MKIIPCCKNYSYTESGQSNPLRWTMLYRVDDKTFEAKTSEFRCKDYFNECVALYHGHELNSIYGFVAKDLKLNEEGVYVRLRNIADDKCYIANIGSINKLAAQYDMPPVSLEVYGDGYIALIPRKYFDSTWLISLMTYLMRVANVKEIVADPAWKKHPTKSIDCPFMMVFDKVMDQGFKTPANVNTYYYAGQKFNYSEKPRQPEYVHNNGVYSWVSQLSAEGKM